MNARFGILFTTVAALSLAAERLAGLWKPPTVGLNCDAWLRF